MLLVPGVMDVYETAQAAWFGPREDRVQNPQDRAQAPGKGGLKMPNAMVVNVTLPVGGIAPDRAASVTVAVQFVDWNTTTGLGAHDTVVLVGSTVTVWVTVVP